MFHKIGYALVAFVFLLLPLGAFIYAVILTTSPIDAAEALGAYLGAVAAIGTATFVVFYEKKMREREDNRNLRSIYDLLHMEILEYMRFLIIISTIFADMQQRQVNKRYRDISSLLRISDPLIYASNTHVIARTGKINDRFPIEIIGFYSDLKKLQSMIGEFPQSEYISMEKKWISSVQEMAGLMLGLGSSIVHGWHPDSEVAKKTKVEILEEAKPFIEHVDVKKGP